MNIDEQQQKLIPGFTERVATIGKYRSIGKHFLILSDSVHAFALLCNHNTNRSLLFSFRAFYRNLKNCKEF